MKTADLEHILDQAAIDYCQEQSSELNDWEAGFIDSCEARNLLGSLSKKQKITLSRLALKLGFTAADAQAVRAKYL